VPVPPGRAAIGAFMEFSLWARLRCPLHSSYSQAKHFCSTTHRGVLDSYDPVSPDQGDVPSDCQRRPCAVEPCEPRGHCCVLHALGPLKAPGPGRH
jgi:hypothetical protein